MVTFKLIQLYPGSGPLGYVLKPVNKGLSEPGIYYQNGIWFNPSDYPKYWQEVKELTLLEEKVVEKDYEILSLFFNGHFYELSNKKLNKTEFKYLSKTTGGHCELTDLNIKFEDSEMNVKIHSVKRKSDGEIFTIGDDVIFELGKGRCHYTHFRNDKCAIDIATKIVSFVIQEDTLTIQIEYNKLCYSLDAPEKVKQSLFTTEDGVDIFDYSKNHFYFVKKESFKLCENLKVINQNVTFKYEPEKELYFSTKGKAEEYILMNKPLLSLSDVWDNLKVKDQKEVMKFVKSKLNKNG